jgi:head-tail adaptor
MLPYRVTIQSRSTGPGPVVWTDTATTWADVQSQPFGNPETASASGLRSLALYLVRLRMRAIDPTQRIVWNGKTLFIHGVRPLDRSYVELLCGEES